jgi:hypothetical protein
MRRNTIKDHIAKAIHEADTTYFFEDYALQAEAVLAALTMAGFEILPERPSKTMCEAGEEAILVGRHKADIVVSEIYEAMIAAWRAKKNTGGKLIIKI